MILLSIDPGNQQSAYLIYDTASGRPIPGRFGIKKNEELRQMLIDGELHADHMAIEMIACYGMAVGAAVFDTCVWVGRFIEVAAMPHTRVYRKDVKLHLCGTHRAKDANVRQALIDRFGQCGTKKEPGALYGISKDVWSALAVAVTHADISKAA